MTKVILHAPGTAVQSKRWQLELRNALDRSERFSLPKEITVLTWNTGSNYKYYNGHQDNLKKMGWFEKSLETHGIEPKILGQGVKDENWTNFQKIPLALDALKQVETKYVLFADSCDAILINNLDKIIDDFLSFQCGVLFNGEFRPFREPFSPLNGSLTQSWELFENKVSKGPFKHINSGVFFGDRKSVTLVLEQCLSVPLEKYINQKKINSEARMSDQVRLKCVFPVLHPLIQVDCNQLIFETVSVPNSRMMI